MGGSVLAYDKGGFDWSSLIIKTGNSETWHSLDADNKKGSYH